ncbi:MAG: b-glycosidase, partial [Sphingobacteriales bacterium]
HNGLCDLQPEGDVLKRVECIPYIDELRRWQKELNRVTELDEDPFSDPVELQDVIDAAERLKKKGDADWH